MVNDWFDGRVPEEMGNVETHSVRSGLRSSDYLCGYVLDSDRQERRIVRRSFWGMGMPMNWRVILRPWCWMFGHRRGKPVPHHAGTFACPRCSRQTRYKVQPPNRGTPTDGSPARTPAEETVQYLERQREKLR